jgi:hypothetical protein
MKSILTKVKLAAIAVVFAALHYAVFSISYVEAEVPGAGRDPATSAVIKGILSFPLGYLASKPSLAELFLVIVASNSLLWGIACAWVVQRLTRVVRRTSAS